MPSRGRKFVTEFLIPCLNSRKFGSKLKWLCPYSKVFQLHWNHKSAADWTEKDACVFIEWDKRKGHYKPKEKEYFVKSKQRFRAVLNKLIKEKHIVELGTSGKHCKVYQIESLNASGMSDSCYNVEFIRSLEDGGSVLEDHRYALTDNTNLQDFSSVGTLDHDGTSSEIKLSYEDSTFQLYGEDSFTDGCTCQSQYCLKDDFANCYLNIDPLL